MLTGLSIRDIVLIDRLDLSFDRGLTVLTGETGAGKSILLDSLGLATGARADRALVRHGAEAGMVTAEFMVAEAHPVCRALLGQGVDPDSGHLILRRQLSVDGKSRAWINDQPITQSFLSDIGTFLLEVHGQHDDRGLLEASAHRDLLDSFGGYKLELQVMASAYTVYQNAVLALAKAEQELTSAQADEDYILHAKEELAALHVTAGEEDTLNERRSLMMQGEKLSGDLQSFLEDLSGRTGADSVIRGVLRRMERIDGAGAERVQPILHSLDRASIELTEAIEALTHFIEMLEFDPEDLEATEDRLFEIRRLARKHNCLPDALPDILSLLESQADALSAGDEKVRAAREQLKTAKSAMGEAVAKLTKARIDAAQRLDKLVTAELPPLKLEKAIFRTRVEPLSEADWSQYGGERVTFEVKTNPSTPFGPMVKIASGGELARFILALKVVLAEGGNVPVMVFDEVDKGIGGATASAVGERLKRLSVAAQVLVVTHSPQVAACGNSQFQITKGGLGGEIRTAVTCLTENERREEIARMLAGSEITDAARAAADQLLQRAKG
ncbi:DNA repair protein RecN [Kordiimonas pumila]|uniref:DNA repair protein RecN n=1 Tax=Kordiimonas pumila TaxID=2161677 RepID=A0ABV7D9T9_9PROT|nr:DNA repair protein RecN [Kordiimonas pumila]